MKNSIINNPAIFLPGSGQNFVAEDGTSDMYRLTLANKGNSADDQLIAICPGDNYTAAELSTILGRTVAAVIADGSIVTTTDKVVTCEGTPGKVVSFKKSFLRKPQRYTLLTIEVDNTVQLSQPIEVLTDDPYNGGFIPKKLINPHSFKSNTQQNDKLVHIPLDHFQMDANTIVLMKVKAATELTISFKPGGNVDTASMLEAAAETEFVEKGLRRVYGKA